MKYCPHCRRPTARVAGPCPHCGRDLSGASGKPSVKPSVRPSARPPSFELEPEEEESYSLRVSGGTSGLDLELSVVDEDLIADRVKPQALSSLQIAQNVSGFGKVETGIVGAVKYWLRVRKRLKELRVELASAEEKKRVAVEKRLSLEAELGRSIMRLQVNSPSMSPWIQLALSAERDLKAREAGRSSHVLEHKKRMETFEEEIRSIESSVFPYREKEAKLLEEKKALDQKKRGFETTRKRHQIDLQNTDALIAQKRASQNAPGTDKMKLAADIVSLESKRQSLAEQISGLEKSLSLLTEPFSALDAKLEAVRAEIKPFDDKCGALKSDFDSIRDQFAQNDSKEVDAIQQESERVLEAWAEAGRQAVTERFSHPEITFRQSAVITATKEALDATAAVEGLAMAETSYDQKTVQTAKLAVAVAASAIVLVLIVIFAMI